MDVLIAEDDATALKVLENCVRRWGYEPRTAKNGAEACDILLDPKGPDLAILDCLMPVMNGFDTLREIRQNRRLKGLPVIMVTAMGSEDDIIRGYQCGTNDYILKPFSEEQLVARIKNLLILAA